jgi:predicted nucleotidyltransferase
VYLFGSSAQGTEHATSDVDLAVWAEAPLSAPLRFGLAEACSRRLHREVDLVDLASASTVLAAQVVGGGELVFARDPVAVAEFEVTVLAKYCHLNEERRELIADIQRRGAIHGG